MSTQTQTGIMVNHGGEQRLIGRVAARLHAAHIQLPLGEAHTYWLQIDQAHRDYWEGLAREVVLRFNDDNRWAIS